MNTDVIECSQDKKKRREEGEREEKKARKKAKGQHIEHQCPCSHIFPLHP